ncbi:MAG: hypothetical protein KC619_10360 [Myxococcales bacterium]|nr:hypothetical protein [Myxococcales bacterium]
MSGRGLVHRFDPAPEPLAFVEPWFRADHDGPQLESRPWIQQFTVDEFIDALFDGIGRSDAGFSPEAWEKLVPFRDFGEVPDRLWSSGGARYEDDLIRELTRPEDREDEQPVPSAPGPAWMRKLYRPFHRHFHVVSAELVCRRPGLPRVGPRRRVIENGIVVRRLVPGRGYEKETDETWEDWVVGPKGGTWARVASGDMRLTRGTKASSRVDPARVPVDALEETTEAEQLLIRLGLPKEADTFALAPQRSVAIPDTIGKASAHTASYAFLPVGAGEAEVERLTPAQVMALATELRTRAATALDEELRADLYRMAFAPAVRALAAQLLPPAPPHTSSVGPRVDDLLGRLLERAWQDLDAGEVSSTEELWEDVLASYAGAHPDVDLDAERVELEGELWGLVKGMWPVPTPTMVEPLWLPRAYRLLVFLLVRSTSHRRALFAAMEAVLGAGAGPTDLALASQPALRLSIDGWASVSAGPQPWDEGELASSVGVHAALARLEDTAASILDRIQRAAGSALGDVLDGAWAVVDALLRSTLPVASAMPPAIPPGGDEETRARLERKRWDDYFRRWGLEPRSRVITALLHTPSTTSRPETLTTLRSAVLARYESMTEARKEEVARARAAGIAARFDAEHVYAVWCYARVRAKDACQTEQIVWSRRTEPFTIADPLDVLGIKPVAVTLPSIPKLVRSLPRIQKARANPVASVTTPAGSGFSIGEEVKDTRLSGGGGTCTYGMPVFTICAWIMFQIVLALLLLIPGFSWLLSLKFCFPTEAE